MIVDNWTQCPKCEENNLAGVRALEKRKEAAYGNVSLEEFKELEDEVRLAYEAIRNDRFSHPDSFREDWEIGVDGNTFAVSYTGSCRVCSFKHRFNHTEVL